MAVEIEAGLRVMVEVVGEELAVSSSVSIKGSSRDVSCSFSTTN